MQYSRTISILLSTVPHPPEANTLFQERASFHFFITILRLSSQHLGRSSDLKAVIARDVKSETHILAAEEAALDDNRVSGNDKGCGLTTVTDGIRHHVFRVDNLKAAISETLDEVDFGLGSAIVHEVTVVQSVSVLHRQAELTSSVRSAARHHGEDVSNLLLVQLLVRVHVSNLATARSGVNFYFYRRRSVVDGDLEDDREPIQYRIVQPFVKVFLSCSVLLLRDLDISCAAGGGDGASVFKA